MNKHNKFLKFTHNLLFIIFIHLFCIFEGSAIENINNGKDWKDNIPDELKPYINWVIKDADFSKEKCPFGYDNFNNKVCFWPSSLKIKVNKNDIDFQLIAYVYKEGMYNLIGDNKNIPYNVFENGEKLPVVMDNLLPATFFNAGKHTISGKLAKQPEVSVSPTFAIINITNENNEEIAPKFINEKLQIYYEKAWQLDNVKSGNEDNIINDEVKIEVLRALYDSIPMKMKYVIKLDVFGKERNINLGKIITPNSSVYSYSSNLPIKNDNNNNFIVHAKSGKYIIVIDTILNDVVNNFKLTKSTNDFPSEEIWAYDLDKSLRLTEVKKVTPIDRSKINNAFQEYISPSALMYFLKENDAFEIKEVMRAPKITNKKHLTLTRNIYINFDGKGAFSEDILSGLSNQEMFLEASHDVEPAKVSVKNAGQMTEADIPILISEKNKALGVNISNNVYEVVSESRFKNFSSFQISPWNIPVSRVILNVNTPPNWEVFHVSGAIANNLYSSWVGTWSLLSIFGVIFACLLILKVASVKYAVALFFACLVFHHFNDSFAYFIICIIVINIIRSFIKAYNEKNLVPLTWLLKCLTIINIFVITILTLSIVPQTFFNIRANLFPSLVHTIHNSEDFRNGGNDYRQISRPSSFAMMKREGSVANSELDYAVEAPIRNDIKRINVANEVKSNKWFTNITTGYGKPIWKNNQLYLNTDAPIKANDKITIYYITPCIQFCLSIIRLILFLVVLYSLIGKTVFSKLSVALLKVSNNKDVQKTTLCLLLCLGINILFPHSNAFADKTTNIPSKEVLDELKEYVVKNINRKPSCMPNCANVNAVNITENKDAIAQELILTFEVSAINDSIVPLFSSSDNLFIKKIKVNDNLVAQATKQNNFLALYVPKGVNTVKVIGRYSDNKDVTLKLYREISKIFYSGKSFDLSLNNTPTSQILLKRKLISLNDSKNKEQLDRLKKEIENFKVTLVPFYEVKRILNLAQEFEMITTVKKQGRIVDATTISLELQRNEKVLEQDDVHVENNHVKIFFAPFEKSKSFISKFPINNEIKLKASSEDYVFESWKININERYNSEIIGSPEIARNDRIRVPRKSESILLKIKEVDAIESPLTTITNSDVEYMYGDNILNARLKFKVRSFLGGSYKITIPNVSKITNVNIDGINQPINFVDNELSIDLKQGEQIVRVSWTSDKKWQNIMTTDKIDLKINSINSSVVVKLPKNDRWILYLKGPKIGPFVFSLSYLPIIFIISFMLIKFKNLKIKFYEWLFLFIGIGIICNQFLVGILPLILLILLKYHSSITKKLGKELFIFCYIASFLSIIFYVLRQIISALLNINPTMGIGGNGSNVSNLYWYQDVISNIIPTPTIVSLHIFYYKVFMILWLVWFSFFIIRQFTIFGKELLMKGKFD